MASGRLRIRCARDCASSARCPPMNWTTWPGPRIAAANAPGRSFEIKYERLEMSRIASETAAFEESFTRSSLGWGIPAESTGRDASRRRPKGLLWQSGCKPRANAPITGPEKTIFGIQMISLSTESTRGLQSSSESGRRSAALPSGLPSFSFRFPVGCLRRLEQSPSSTESCGSSYAYPTGSAWSPTTARGLGDAPALSRRRSIRSTSATTISPAIAPIAAPPSWAASSSNARNAPQPTR